MRILIPAFALAVFTACNAEWTAVDLDGDGSPFGEDCNEDDPNIGPGMEEIWYDGIDQNCDGNDADKDGDGYVPAGLDYDWSVFPAHLAEGDCWDDPDLTPDGMETVSGFTVVAAADVNPGATDTWYDGPDQDCGGNSDFDQDGDGYDSSEQVQADGSYGDDCADGSELDDAIDVRCTLIQALEKYELDETLEGVLAYIADPNQDGDTSDGRSLGFADIHPGADDLPYDGLDEDCDGSSDWDQDGDSYDRCDECDDEDAAKYPDDSVEELWYNCSDENCDGNDGDQDGDGYVTDDYAASCPEWADFTSHFAAGDCWDDAVDTTDIPTEMDPVNGGTQRDPSEVYPGAADDVYDDVDSACDGEAADGSSASATEFDYDGDGYDTSDYADRSGSTGTDCDDDELSTYPGATETCDEVDSDCDDDLNDPNSIGCSTWYYDGDQDGYGDENNTGACYCEARSDNLYTSATNDDCDDSEDTDYPGATETVANGDDEDCDGGDTCYVDDDGDSYGDEDASTVSSADLDCTDSGEANDTDDCDDGDADTYPGAAFNESSTSCRNDDDGDGYGDDTVSGSVVAGTDCDDTDEDAYLGATEVVADGVDQSCSGGDTCYVDDDGDTYGDDDGSTVLSTDLDCTDSGEADNDDDCKDNNAYAYPGSAELDSTTACMEDRDGDGYGDDNAPSGVTDGTDCDDSDSGDYPGATETVNNGDDEDCDGGDTCYVDDDGDGYGDDSGATTTSADLDCTDNGEADDTDDCDDTDEDTYPGVADEDSTTACMNDDDGDGYGDDSPPSGVTAGTDCDDGEASDYPGATETVANGDDEDCDGGDTCYVDDDGDSYGDEDASTVSSADLDCTDSGEADNDDDCDDGDADTYPGAAFNESSTSCRNDDDGDGYGDDTVSGSVVAGGDCNDADSAINPGEDEICDASDTDEDCNGVADDDDSGALSSGKTTTYVDDDGDGEGDADASATLWCDVPSGYVTNNDDCDDSSSAVNTSATEVTADGIDNDCDGKEQCYVDSDGDDYGSTSTVASANLVCTNSGEADNDDDCDDGDSDTFPGAAENESASSCRTDADGDGYGDDSPSSGVTAGDDCDDSDDDTYPGAAYNESASSCRTDADGDGYGSDSAGSGVTNGDDCDDGDSDINPGASETVADGIDQDCDEVDDCYTDSDGDGYGSTTTQTGSDLTCANGDEADDDDDCDDTDEFTFPGAAENESASACRTDADEDGYGSETAPSGGTAGEDCDDSDSSISPAESGNDDRGTSGVANVDDDCDDVVDEDYAWTGGEVIFSEIHMYSELVNEKNGEWVELYNTSASETYYLDGWEIDFETTGSGQNFFIGVDGLVIGPQEYVVLCYKSAVLASAGCDYEYGGDVDNGSSDAGDTDNASARLANSGDDIGLYVGSTTLDEVTYEDSSNNWPDSDFTGDGISLELGDAYLDSSDNDDGANWCLTGTTGNTYRYYNNSGTAEHGTPQASASCTP